MGLTSVIYILMTGLGGLGPVYELDPSSGSHAVSAKAAYWEDPSALTLDEVILPENQKPWPRILDSTTTQFGFV